MRSGSNRGQVAVESALAMPLMTFVVLVLLQLTAMEQARVMTEYAAFQATRAGIVWGGNNERMRDAALMALLPTLGHATNDLPNLTEAWLQARRVDSAVAGLDWGGSPRSVNGAPLRGLVRVDTVNPAGFPEIDRVWNVRDGPGWQELDFDGPESFPEDPSIGRRIRRFFHLEQLDRDQETYRKATVLSIRLRYWYELRLPFANWGLFIAWYAANAGVLLGGAVDRPTLDARANLTHRSGDARALESQATQIDNQKGFPTATREEMSVLWGLADGSIPMREAGAGHRFFIPISATYSMRMQSNFNRKWLVHPEPAWNL